MNNFIVGNDISAAQGSIDWLTYQKNTNFVLMKATEGVGFIDTWFGNNRERSRFYMLPKGFYHFARPDLGNSPQDEAAYFLNILSGDPIQEGEVLALDYEVAYSDPVTWCKDFLEYVSSNLNGIKPFLYLNQSLASSYDWTPVVNGNFGLWIAGYTYDPANNNVNTGSWSSAAMQQWTNKQQVPGIAGNVDGDVFFGDVVSFHKYGYKKPQITSQTNQNTSSNQTTPIVIPSTQSGNAPIINNTNNIPPQPNKIPTLTPTQSMPQPQKSLLDIIIGWLISIFLKQKGGN